MPHPPQLRCLAAVALAGSALVWWTTAAIAQSDSPEPPELAALRSGFLEALNQRLAPLNRSYVLALEKAEKQLAEAGDYEGAIAVRDERRAVAQMLIAASIRNEPEPAAPQPAPAKGEPVVFAAADAIPGGAATTGGERAMVMGAGDSLTWKAGSLKPGGYEVELSYACAGAATFWVKESFFRLKGAVEAAPGGKRVSLGSMKITADTESITLAAIEIPDDGLAIQQLTLTPDAE